MKILMLTPYLPFPLHSGGQIRSYNLLKKLARKHQITLFSFIRSPKEKIYIKELKRFCTDVKVFKRRQAWDIRNIFFSALTPFPFLVSIYLCKTLKKALKAELSTGDYDLIHAETFYVMPNLPRSITVPTLLVEQTIEYLVYQRFVENFKIGLLKPFLYFDVLKIKLWEKYFWGKATRLAAMSAADKKIIQDTVKGLKIDVVANGVDTAYFAKTKKRLKKQPTILFVGNFKWLPNRDAAVFLTKEIWPYIRRKLPQARLWIVGRNPTKEIFKLADYSGVKITGDIKDIRIAFSQANVLLAPIRNGRGTKYKVLEAMACGVPVITTQLGIEGIDAKDNYSVLIAESAQNLAEKTVKVLTDEKLSQKLTSNGKKLVSEGYNWQVISRQLDKIYQQSGGK